MSQSDRTAVGVYFLWIETGFFDYRQRLRGESFVQFDQRRYRKASAGHLQGFRYCEHRAESHFFGLVSGGGEGNVGASGFDAEGVGAFGGHDYGGGRAVGHLRGISGSDCTFDVERGFQREKASSRGVGTRALRPS